MRHISRRNSLDSRRSSLGDYSAPTTSSYFTHGSTDHSGGTSRGPRPYEQQHHHASTSFSTSSSTTGTFYSSGTTLSVIRRRLGEMGPAAAAAGGTGRRRRSSGSSRLSGSLQLLYGEQDLYEELMQDIYSKLMEDFGGPALPGLLGQGSRSRRSSLEQPSGRQAAAAAGSGMASQPAGLEEGSGEEQQEGEEQGSVYSAMSFGGESSGAAAPAIGASEAAVEAAMLSAQRHGSMLMADDVIPDGNGDTGWVPASACRTAGLTG